MHGFKLLYIVRADKITYKKDVPSPKFFYIAGAQNPQATLQFVFMYSCYKTMIRSFLPSEKYDFDQTNSWLKNFTCRGVKKDEHFKEDKFILDKCRCHLSN